MEWYQMELKAMEGRYCIVFIERKADEIDSLLNRSAG